MALILASPATDAQTSPLTGTFALSSQLVDRGMAITPPGPVLQGAINWTSPSGWSAGVSASAQARTPRGFVSFVAQVAHSWSLATDWQMQANLLDYRYPSHGRGRTYDRTELGVSWIYRDVLTFGVSASHLNRYGGQRPRGAADLGLHWPLARGFSLSASAGAAQELVPPRGAGYERRNHYYYGHAGLTWDNGPWRIEVAHITSNRDRRAFQPEISPWTATVSRAF
ncbi:TorF family putative porin [Luteibacter sp.]|uniref:TorF family putative porin n=1 Tax=Luteibacter sp. TaxID=1886636 RepID=UPI002F41F468